MTWKFSTFWTFCFSFVFWSFVAVHFAHMKTPTQARDVASWSPVVKPWYDASWKL